MRHTPNTQPSQLSDAAQLYVVLEDASNDEEKFLACVKHASAIHRKKRRGLPINDALLSIIMQKISLYLRAGVNPNAVTKDSHNPLFEDGPVIFEALGFPALLKLLLSHGANPNACDRNGHHPLHKTAHLFYKQNIASYHHYFTCAEMLASKGADIRLTFMTKRPIDLFVNYALTGETENSMLALRENFRQATESPRNFDDIPFDAIDPSADETLPLTEQDHLDIQSYRARAMLHQMQPTTPRTGPFSGMRFGFIQSDHRHNNEPLHHPGDYTHRR